MKKLKTYSEVKKKLPFDWNKALSVDCRDMTKADVQLMIKRAGSWVTCACGSQCDILERDKDGMPLNENLSQLGYSFFADGIMPMANHAFGIDADWLQKNLAVANLYRKDSIKILHKIEKLSAKLINEQIEKSKATLLKLGYKITKK